MTPHIHRRTFGSGPHPILAIHCSLAHSGAWRGLAAALGDRVTLHAFDLPNHGKSGDWDGTGDMHDTAAAMARAVLDDIGGAPIDVIGHSFGATVALRLAVEMPTRLRRAALFEPVFFAPAFADNPGFRAEYAAVDDARHDAYVDGRLEDAARIFNRHWAGAGTWHTLSERTRADMAKRIGFVHHSGRTHQLRVHAAHPQGLNAPIVGDTLYGAKAQSERLQLHAMSIKFAHPTTGQSMAFDCPVPF